MINEEKLIVEIQKRNVVFTEEQLDLSEYLIESQPKLDADTNVGGKLKKTEKFNRMIEAFECDFSLIQQGEKTFAQLDENLKVEKVNVNSLRKDMDLMQELSYLIRHGKAEIWLKEGE